MTAITGLIFPSNGSPSVQFQFTGANLINAYPVTFIWRRTVVQQDGYYTTFFWGPTGAFTGAGYYGAQPYPTSPPSGSQHQWEISIEGSDPPYPGNTDDNGNSVIITPSSTFLVQALTVQVVNTNELLASFYYNLPNTSDLITWTTNSDYTNSFPPSSPGLTFGDAPWNQTNEELSGTFRGLQLYSAVLSQANILTESANQTLNAAQTSAGQASLFYINQNPTPTDITDKSGLGHNPAWVNANRPLLYTGTIPDTNTTARLQLGRLIIGNNKVRL